MRISYTFRHIFFPGRSNNQKAKLLHNPSLVVVIFTLIVFQFVLQTAPLAGINILGYASDIPPTEIVRLTNEKRLAAGLGQLTMNPQLTSAARAKGEHMLANDYWAHIAPDGTEPWKFFSEAGYSYKYAGENLARDFTNPVSAIEAWIASPTHKDNLLSVKYNEIGIAVVEGDLAGVDTTIIVQLFGSKPSAALQIPEVTQTENVAQANPVPTAAVATPAPTVLPTRYPEAVEIPSDLPSTNLVAGVPSETGPVGQRVLISPFSTTKGLSVAVVGILLLVLLIDGLVTSRRRVSRIGGRTFAHLAFLGMILAIAIILRSGSIL